MSTNSTNYTPFAPGSVNWGPVSPNSVQWANGDSTQSSNNKITNYDAAISYDKAIPYDGIYTQVSSVNWSATPAS